jgi:hypothetical protein
MAQNKTESMYPFSLSEISSISPIVLPDLDFEKIKKEDASKVFDIRFAAPIPCQIALEKDGQWHETAEKRLWLCKIKSNKAEGLSLLFKHFYLPKGATLSFFSPDKKQNLGIFDEKSNNNEGTFLTNVLLGETIVLQYEELKNNPEKGSFEIFSAYHVYKKHHLNLPSTQEKESADRGDERLNFGFGTAQNCNININCPQVDTSIVKDIKRGVVRITMVLKEGMGYCTGTVMNNTAKDGKPYILSAYHCEDGYTPYYNLWKFDFHYESPNCNNPTQEPVNQSIIGCVKRSGWVSTDFLLLELTTPINNNFNTFYNGWNRTTDTPVGNTYMVHHASGDIKKYSETNFLTLVYNQPIQWNNMVTTPANFHFRNKITVGIIEVGSSGCGLFNKEKQLVANFNGGEFDLCTVNGLYYGRLSKSWEGNGTPQTRLKDWLDPLNSGAMEMNGENRDNKIVRGKINDPLNKNTSFKMAFVTYDSTSQIIDNDTLTLSKSYSRLILPRAKSLLIQPIKKGIAADFLSTADLVLMSKHILGAQPLTEPWQLFAGDVNLSGTVSTADIVECRKIILGLKSSFEKQTPWAFRITNLNTPTNMNILGNGGIRLNQPFLQDSQVDFQGIKIGDVNGNGY